MAEERLIDDELDKNKKYKIRKNADGEEELYFDGEETEEGENAEYGAEFYEVPAFSEDDESAGVLTPDQLAERAEARRIAEENKRLYVAECVGKATELLGEGDFEGALYNLNSAEYADEKCGDVYALKIKALTRNFCDFTALDDCVACSEGIRRYCSDGQKEELSASAANVEKHIEKLEEQAAGLHVEVESKKSERRAVYSQKRNKSIKLFGFTIVPFIACLIFAISFGSVMFAKQNGANLILTIVFAALSVIFFVATVITSHGMWTAMRKYSLNEKNSSTRIGREYEELLTEIKKLKTVLTSFKK